MMVLGKWPHINIGIGMMVKKGSPNEMGSPPLGLSIMSSHVRPTSSMASWLWLKQWDLFPPFMQVLCAESKMAECKKAKQSRGNFPPLER
jgi:hypothetical protein